MTSLGMRLTLVLGVLAPAPVPKSADKPTSKGKSVKAVAAPIVEEEAEGTPARRSLHQRDFTKVRKDSALRAGDLLPPSPDLRGRLQRLRDHEVLVHFQRLARLDVIAEVAQTMNHQHLLDRVDEVRRRELERFRRAMLRLRRETEALVADGRP